MTLGEALLTPTKIYVKLVLDLIKKYYGENMMHLCRKLFPTILEKKGLLLYLQF